MSSGLSKTWVWALLLVVMSVRAFALEERQDPAFHLDRTKLPYGCSSCHAGFDFRSGGGSIGCLACHGGNAPASGIMNPTNALQDVASEFKKTYHHPVLETGKAHSSAEQLPEMDPRAPRHVACMDCHNPHLIGPGKRFAGIKGKRNGNQVAEITAEYQLCYRCHGESANLPARSTNKQAEFSLSNPSFHPVEGEGRNQAVVSLVKPYKEKQASSADISIISCTTCHGSENRESPKGPHGSSHQHILTDNFSSKDGEAESYLSYALCYRCHSRTSILGDESFRYHSLHIKGKGGSLWSAQGTSCFTCHSPHGSLENKYLINFNKEVVTPNSAGLLKFAEKGANAFSGECYLTCHGVDHNPKRY